MSTTIQILQASHGDCIFVRHEQDGQKFNLLIDGGPAETFGSLYGYPMPLRLLLDELRANGEFIDLAIVTHVDDDHIGGLLEAISYDEYMPTLVKEFWFNSYKIISSEYSMLDAAHNYVSGVAGSETKTSITQGMSLEDKLSKLAWHDKVIHNDLPPIVRGGLEFTILSPSVKSLKRLGRSWEREYPPSDKKTAGRETDHNFPISHFLKNDKFTSDRSVPNGSSIAFVLKLGDANLMFLADSYASIVERKLKALNYSVDNPICCDLVKVSHHGSKGNTSKKLLDLISSKRYVISTDGSIFGHPDKRLIARILNANDDNNIFFNYESVMRSVLLPEDAAYTGRLHVCDAQMVL